MASYGSFSPSPIAVGDTNVGTSSFIVTLDTADNGGAGSLISFGVGEGPYNAGTFYNKSTTMMLRINLTFTGQTAGGSDREFIVPASGVYSFVIDGDAVSQFSAQYVDTPVVAGIVSGQSATVPIALTGLHQFVANFVNT
jgi:hypothetical protein